MATASTALLDQKEEKKSPTLLLSLYNRPFHFGRLPLSEKEVEVLSCPDLLSKEDADTLFNFCLNELPWEVFQVRLYGKVLNQPRMSCMMGRAYNYSGFNHLPKEWHPFLWKIAEELTKICQSLIPNHPAINGVLCNYYRSGAEYISLHPDKEIDLIPGAYIVSISLGAERFFDLHHNDIPEKVRMVLTHGSLLLMGKGCQTHYKHQVPKQLTITQPRINLTFRCFKD